MKAFAIDRTNGICAALFIVFGAFFALQSLGLEIGTAFRMGPGYFPLVLAIVLILLGLVILVQAMRFEGDPIGYIAWRGSLFILPAPIFFGLTVRGLGFIPSIFLTALIASFASGRMKPLTAFVLSTGLTLFAFLVFSYALGLPFRRFGPWLPL
ncbi:MULTISPECIES: tripartite tricarboxylate transporter TctB family protein [unclassified Mesorhizobium]|uniref:tripartite tricarboxylate transporter TctB family protein n=1 Tax=unclassified Mesorhizobium TaxID=325217 RepID=UPI00112BE5BF|nr:MULTISPECIES: tripartite tricarboxylate transporter TctB family protein [unclassified Mesorhizobium]TPJ37834.1 tripartite tricarboxylate transporter TctB family protein [Mesorhizobium sp. B2-6-6]MBZ9980987.1 tripartite tricarboxylate transporter TctB family protein [Mesorhizobium sp. BR-1-1-8]MBZ9999597.1 tripartite tricarboxylate transporter TctB family protein [Mesorhizobium sp. B264B2A]MCA0008071.1 tripartite tricarboxylate transporter TctB family protein [Mesorhizobium sp. B264B1B]MCA00